MREKNERHEMNFPLDEQQSLKRKKLRRKK